jgi:hypothetical protein
MGTVIAGPWGAGDPPITPAPPPLEIRRRRASLRSHRPHRRWAIIVGSVLLIAASGVTAIVLTDGSGHHRAISSAVSQTQYQAEARKIDLDMKGLQAAMDDAAQNNNYAAAYVFMDTLATDLAGFDTRVAAMRFPAGMRNDVQAMLADDAALRADIKSRTSVTDAAATAWLQTVTADFIKAGDAHALVRTDLGLPRNAPEPTQTPVWL